MAIDSNTPHLIRSRVWTDRLREAFLESLMARSYVDWLSEFPDGEEFVIPAIGQGEAKDYQEGERVTYSNLVTGEMTFRITDYVYSAYRVSRKLEQDSFVGRQVLSKIEPMMRRAIDKRLEIDILKVGPEAQTSADYNEINGAPHRWVASGTNAEITIEDFAHINFALAQANVPHENLIGFVDPSVALTLEKLVGSQHVSQNPRWEGLLDTGVVRGNSFVMNILGIDIYQTPNLKQGVAETIGTKSVSDGVANIFFAAIPEAMPLIGAVRQEPIVDAEFNKDEQVYEYVTTTRYGLAMQYEENFVTILSSKSAPVTV